MMRIASPSRNIWTTKRRAQFWGQPDDSIALFATCSGVFNTKERVEEHLTGLLKGDAMLHEIGRCLIDIPKEALALIEEGDIHHF
jgi:hypothetical protein